MVGRLPRMSGRILLNHNIRDDGPIRIRWGLKQRTTGMELPGSKLVCEHGLLHSRNGGFQNNLVNGRCGVVGSRVSQPVAAVEQSVSQAKYDLVEVLPTWQIAAVSGTLTHEMCSSSLVDYRS